MWWCIAALLRRTGGFGTGGVSSLQLPRFPLLPSHHHIINSRRLIFLTLVKPLLNYHCISHPFKPSRIFNWKESSLVKFSRWKKIFFPPWKERRRSRIFRGEGPDIYSRKWKSFFFIFSTVEAENAGNKRRQAPPPHSPGSPRPQPRRAPKK